MGLTMRQKFAFGDIKDECDAIPFMLEVLPAFVLNDKGTKFFLHMKAYDLKSGSGWQVSYVYQGQRLIPRKGYPVIKADTLPEALEQMLTWINDNHPKQLNWD